MKKGQIGVSHLVYIIIIFVIVLSFFLVIAFGGIENASRMVGTASTVSSLILSVIAIVLSLLDVAGQRESMIDLKETADKLQESNVSSSSLIEELTVKMHELQGMKEQMIEAVSASEEWQKGLVDEIQGLKQKEIVKQEDLEELYGKANEALYFEHIKANPQLLRESMDINSILWGTINYLRQVYKPNDQISSDKLIEIIAKRYNSPKFTSIRILKRLVDLKYVTYKFNSENDEPYLRLNDKLFNKDNGQAFS